MNTYFDISSVDCTILVLMCMGTTIIISVIFTRGTTFVTSSSLHCRTALYHKKSTFKGKNLLLQYRSKFFPLKVVEKNDNGKAASP